MEVQRNRYLQQLLEYAWNGQVKVITGIRRCGKSYLLRTLYKNYLTERNVSPDHIIQIELDQIRDMRFRNPIELVSYVRERIGESGERFYLFVDELQLSDTAVNPYSPEGKRITFYDALNDLRSIENLDIYVTGSNSKMLSGDILTEFRGRSDEIRLHPFSFAEIYHAIGGDTNELFERFAFYGGMPFLLSRPNDESRMAYLQSLFSEVYLKDILERKKIERPDVLGEIVDLLCSSVGSLTNPTNIANSLNAFRKLKGSERVAANTVKTYMDHLEDAFLFSASRRYDVKGRAYFDYPNKYYCEDVGLRNARTGFRQQELTHIMENIVYNELLIRRASVDVGVVYASAKDPDGKTKRVAREIDFIATKGDRKVYLQSAFAFGTEEKAAAERKPLTLTGDSFPKMIVRGDIRRRWYDERGILNIGIVDFLLDDTLI